MPSAIHPRRRRETREGEEAEEAGEGGTLFTCAMVGDASCTARERAEGHGSHHLRNHGNEVTSAAGEYEQVPDRVEVTLVVALIEIRA
ncbi:hypothetical protein XBLMG947_1214 [Xanthomonas bromi]|uniref:Uncharacterized protein n=1 Tax=Xanthomonas bromi TaxID=56449 RepID=A0A1C3NJ68_9XANT|nr:hypothetical protein XBLMG947_1214 [Xanthomonas bromi]